MQWRHQKITAFQKWIEGLSPLSSFSTPYSSYFHTILQPSFDPQLSAKLHNKILEHAWNGTGRDISSLPSTTWWEESSPVSFDLASRLSPKLIQFLRLSKSICIPNTDFHFIYFLHGLQESRDLLRFSILESWGDRFVWLYPGTCSTNEDEVGILLVSLLYWLLYWVDLILICGIDLTKRLS